MTTIIETNETTAPALPPPPAFDFSYAQAVPLMVMPFSTVNLIVVGLGGTGSWLAPHVARLARILADRGKKARVYFIDHDIVEPANCLRQNFADCEVGLHKSRVLALRYGGAWGVDIAAIIEKFHIEQPKIQWGHASDTLTVVVGCVDNAEARNCLSLTLERNKVYRAVNSRTFQAGRDSGLPSVYWLDCGNALESGQVLLGSASSADGLLESAFALAGYCTALPSPALQEPGLLIPKPEELPAGAASAMSCEEMALANAQSLMINQRIAGEASDYLLRLLVTNSLRKFQTYIDLPSGVTRSTYITPDHVGRATKKDETRSFEYLKKSKARLKKEG